VNIQFLCSPDAEYDSPSFAFLPTDVDGYGVGGAEISLIRLAAELVKQGHTVTVWNNPVSRSDSNPTPLTRGTIQVFDGVQYRDADEFDPHEPTDVFILYRNPYTCLGCVDAKVKIFWSTDQQTAGDYREIFPLVDFTVCISDYHKRYFVERYSADPTKIIAIDLGVIIEE
jgi:hypothetical protein